MIGANRGRGNRNTRRRKGDASGADRRIQNIILPLFVLTFRAPLSDSENQWGAVRNCGQK